MQDVPVPAQPEDDGLPDAALVLRRLACAHCLTAGRQARLPGAVSIRRAEPCVRVQDVPVPAQPEDGGLPDGAHGLGRARMRADPQGAVHHRVRWCALAGV